ncbi:MAG: hypothetical protein ACKOQ4_02645 [Mycobacterium sp.]
MLRRRRPQLPWLKRGLVAGASGTAMMAAWYHLERFLRRGDYTGVTTLADGTPVEGLWSHEGLDYDDSVVPGQIVASILNLPKPTDREAGAITLALRWTYGSAFGVVHVLLRNRIREPYASLVFGSALMTMTSVAFPLLGKTPPPWKWPLDVKVSAGGSHAAYILTASVLDNVLR